MGKVVSPRAQCYNSRKISIIFHDYSVLKRPVRFHCVVVIFDVLEYSNNV